MKQKVIGMLIALNDSIKQKLREINATSNQQYLLEASNHINQQLECM
jgi:hypothetical protein